jgi:type IV pilus assembly protein PilB
MSVSTAATPAGAPEYPRGLIAPTHRGRSKNMIGDIIVELGFATREAVDDAVKRSREAGRTTGQMLIESGAVRPDQLARALAERFGVDFIDLSAYEVDMGAVSLVSTEVCKRYQSVPVGFMPDGDLLLATADPTNVLTVDEISMITGKRVHTAVAAIEDITALIGRLNRLGDAVEIEDMGDEDDANAYVLPEVADSEAPVVKLVHQIIAEAVQRGASDIHCDPENGDMRVFFRIDGVLTQAATVARAMTPGLVSRIKIMASLDISEKRLPQDGRLALGLDGRRVDVRVVTLPLVKGEGVVMRILDAGATVRTLETLGMPEEERERFRIAINKPYGAVLVTGPTGSGKSTTLYGALAEVNDGERSILTIEDPVESQVAGVKQMQVANKAGMTFAKGLRAMLRADPDVIMVGEIRDRETAEIAIQAALTGHLVLSTLHTRDAPSAITRLLDMGVEPFMVAAAIDCVVAQRLARMLCEHCKAPIELPEATVYRYGLQGAEIFGPTGCIRCSNTGYRGRVGLYEVMAVDEDVRALLLSGASVDQIAATAEAAGMRRMREDGLHKVRLGLTTLAEIGRVTTGF